ncbi:MAG: EAL domain-containing protein [Pseudomonadota bacterium]
MSRAERWRQRLASTSLRHQLSLGAAAVVTLTILLLALLLITSEYHANRKAMLRDLQVQAQMIAANSSAALVFGDAEAAGEILRALQASADVSAARLLNSGGGLLAEYRADPSQAVSGEVLQLSEPVNYQGKVYGRLVIDAQLHRLKSRLLIYSLGALVVAVLAVLLALLLFAKVVRFITGPVNELIGLMQQVAREGDYSRRSGIAPGNEIGDIASGFDTMLGEIETRQQALTHELQERRRTQAELDRMARHDSLTQLANRHSLEERLESVSEKSRLRQQHYALLLMDLDNFKVVNDSLGHQAGDQLLVLMCCRLRAALGDELPIYRLGGDEFAIVLEGNGLDVRCSALATQLVTLSREVFEVDGHEVYTTMSIGYALYPEHGERLPQLLRNADMALYAAKNQGRDTWRVFTQDMQQRAERRMQAETELRHALERNEFFLMYEPQLDLHTGRLSGVEALLRWRHPQRGTVPPSEFVPLAEETGLIMAIGAWVLKQACTDGLQLLELNVRGNFRLAVNLAPRQLGEASLAELVADTLKSTGFPGNKLELEVTESAMSERIELVAERMNAIAALGVSFALDDFGTGASSLSYLRRLPVQKLKIDRSFICEIPQSRDDRQITAAIISIGARMGLQVVAEGVETAAQRQFLHDQGCSLVQGYYYAKPLALEDFLSHWRFDATITA